MGNRIPRRTYVLALGAALAWISSLASARASDLDTIGITQLRAAHPELTGTGVSVAMAEGTTYTGDPNLPYNKTFDLDDFEWDPSVVFTTPTHPNTFWIDKNGAATTAYNSAKENTTTFHARAVASNYVGTANGAAPGVTNIVTYNANRFVNNVIATNASIYFPTNGPAVKIVNQSFIEGTQDANIDQFYDNYVYNKNIVIVSAAGNSGGPSSPSTAYNLISVGDTDGATAIGPTTDGRSKPDISAPTSQTSFSTPYVSGIAAVMVQAGYSSAGGTGTQTASVDARTIKALLLNGATKPVGWTHTQTQPLDTRFGAGVVNAYNSYKNLAAGKRSANLVNTDRTPLGGIGIGNSGWDFASLTTSNGVDAVAHYQIAISSPSIFTSTLVWERHNGAVSGGTATIMDINHLQLYLYDLSTGSILDQSISSVDNVQHLYETTLNPGLYDLEVVKSGTNPVSAAESYALAFYTSRLDGLDTTGMITAAQVIESAVPNAEAPEAGSLFLLGFGSMVLLKRRR